MGRHTKPSVSTKWTPEHRKKVQEVIERAMAGEEIFPVDVWEAEFSDFSIETIKRKITQQASDMGLKALHVHSKHKAMQFEPEIAVDLSELDGTGRKFTGADAGKNKYKAHVRVGNETVIVQVRAVSEQKAKDKAKSYGNVLKVQLV